MHINLDKVCSGLRHSSDVLKLYIGRKVSVISDHFLDYKFSKSVIGLSGGIDSAVSCALVAKAIGAENAIAYSLPYSTKIHNNSCGVAKAVAKSLGVEDLRTVFITDIVNDLVKLEAERLEERKDICDIVVGNAAARARMMVLMNAATIEHALVAGTENKTEEILGYYTIGGDDTTHFEPICDLYKVEIFQIAKALGLPNCVLDRAPSAELWDGQTDEGELGASYECIDNTLYMMQNGDNKFLVDNKETRAILARIEKVKGKRMCPKHWDVGIGNI